MSVVNKGISDDVMVVVHVPSWCWTWCLLVDSIGLEVHGASVVLTIHRLLYYTCSLVYTLSRSFHGASDGVSPVSFHCVFMDFHGYYKVLSWWCICAFMATLPCYLSWYFHGSFVTSTW